jgi:hypothetical protein
MDPITEQLFDPRVASEQTFEDQMVAMRILHGNLIAKSRGECTIAELYPGAIGHREDLERIITIQELKFCRVNGSSNSSQLVTYNPKEVPVQGMSTRHFNG